MFLCVFCVFPMFFCVFCLLCLRFVDFDYLFLTKFIGAVYNLYRAHDARPFQSSMSILQVHLGPVAPECLDILCPVHEFLCAGIQEGTWTEEQGSGRGSTCPWRSNHQNKSNTKVHTRNGHGQEHGRTACSSTQAEISLGSVSIEGKDSYTSSKDWEWSVCEHATTRNKSNQRRAKRLFLHRMKNEIRTKTLARIGRL